MSDIFSRNKEFNFSIFTKIYVLTFNICQAQTKWVVCSTFNTSQLTGGVSIELQVKRREVKWWQTYYFTVVVMFVSKLSYEILVWAEDRKLPESVMEREMNKTTLTNIFIYYQTICSNTCWSRYIYIYFNLGGVVGYVAAFQLGRPEF